MLGRTNDIRAVEPLCGALKDENYIVRGAAARALGNLGLPTAVTAIKPLLGLIKDEELFVGKEARHALLRLASKDTIEVFSSMLSADDPAVRFTVVQTLSKIDDPEARRALLPALGDIDRQVRDKAIETIKDMTEPDIEKMLHSALSQNEMPLVQITAIHLIGELKSASFIDMLGDLTASDGVDLEVKKAATEVLSTMKDQLNIPNLVVLTSAKDRQTRNRAINLLALHGGQEAVDALLELLHSPDEFIRREAVYALGDAGDRRAIPVLDALYNSEEAGRFREEIKRTIRKLTH